MREDAGAAGVYIFALFRGESLDGSTGDALIAEQMAGAVLVGNACAALWRNGGTAAAGDVVPAEV